MKRLGFGTVLIALMAAIVSPAVHAAVINIGTLPSNGSTLTFSGETTFADQNDLYTFNLPFEITSTNGAYLHMETGNANFDTWLTLWRPSFGTFPVSADDNSDNTFGPCNGTNTLCSSIGAGADPLARTHGAVIPELSFGGVLKILEAGAYTLEVHGFPARSPYFGTYDLKITAFGPVAVPVPPTVALLPFGLLGIFAMSRRSRKAGTASE